MINKLFIWLLLMLCSFRLWATGQEGDRLVIGKDTFQLLATPLQKILIERNITPKDLWGDNPDYNTACWRTYIATWKLQNNKLYLEEVAPCNYYDYPGGTYPRADLKKIFPDLNKERHIFAHWVSEELLAARGKVLYYIHDGFDRVYAEETSLVFKTGKLEKSCRYDTSKTKTAPWRDNEKMLRDYLHSAVNWEQISSEIDSTVKKVYCMIVSADENGKIDSVLVVKGASDILNREAVRVVKSIPQWDVIFKKGQQIQRPWTFPVRFDLETMRKYQKQ